MWRICSTIVFFVTFKTIMSNILYGYNIYTEDPSYIGEYFPQKYLTIDRSQPTENDLKHYMNGLLRVVNHFNDAPNDTDPNVAIGVNLMKAILKKTLIDYNSKLKEEDKIAIKDLINKAENVQSHYIHYHKLMNPTDLFYKLGTLFRFSDPYYYHSIRNFNEGVMEKWIHSKLKLHDYVAPMDNITLPKENYAVLVAGMNYYYEINVSDTCITEISSSPLPIQIDQLDVCKTYDGCVQNVFSMPSVAYALSHRLLYILLIRLTRHCYIITEEIDDMHMDIMCANMYRETVYLARRGFFYKDLFLEHVALCGFLGYREFHRLHWFHKAVSWIDEEGCVVENYNFQVNRSKIYLQDFEDPIQLKKLKRLRKIRMLDDCHTHQMALMMVVLAHGIRYAAHFMGL